MTSFIYWHGVNVSGKCVYRRHERIMMANHIKFSDYFDKFSLLTHTDEQNLYFDNFFYDKCTCSIDLSPYEWNFDLDMPG
jgi:hypothetical protein